MLISAHDYHNKFNQPGNSAVNTSTPAWAHSWNAQMNVSAAQVTKTGGTYALEAPIGAQLRAAEAVSWDIAYPQD